MNEKLKKSLNYLKNKYSLRQGFFVALAVLLFLILVWFVVSNFVFVVDNLNQAFSSESREPQPVDGFDIESFQELNLIE